MKNKIVSFFEKDLTQAALKRAIRTAAQAALGVIGSDYFIGIHSVNWTSVLSVSALAAATSLIMSVAGLPEVEA